MINKISCEEFDCCDNLPMGYFNNIHHKYITYKVNSSCLKHGVVLFSNLNNFNINYKNILTEDGYNFFEYIRGIKGVFGLVIYKIDNLIESINIYYIPTIIVLDELKQCIDYLFLNKYRNFNNVQLRLSIYNYCCSFYFYDVNNNCNVNMFSFKKMLLKLENGIIKLSNSVLTDNTIFSGLTRYGRYIYKYFFKLFNTEGYFVNILYSVIISRFGIYLILNRNFDVNIFKYHIRQLNIGIERDLNIEIETNII